MDLEKTEAAKTISLLSTPSLTVKFPGRKADFMPALLISQRLSTQFHTKTCGKKLNLLESQKSL